VNPAGDGGGPPPFDRPGPELLELALSRPHEALEAADRAILTGCPPLAASFAHHAAGIVLRDRGDLTSAIDRLRRGAASARRAGDHEREADVRATLGTALVWSGRTRQGLPELDRAVESTRGAAAGRNLLRRAAVHIVLGRYEAALADLEAALPRLRGGENREWRARVLTRRAEVHLALGAVNRSLADFDRAEELFRETGQEFEYAIARHNRGLAARAMGDLPAALRRLHEAAELYRAVGTVHPDLATDLSDALLAAGLAREAFDVADSAFQHGEEGDGAAYKQAELLYTSAVAALALPRPDVARERAALARRAFQAQGRELWMVRSTLIRVEAELAQGRHRPALLRRAQLVADRMVELDPERAARAHLVAGRIATALGRAEDAERHLAEAARGRYRSGSPLDRSVAWLAQALRAEVRGDPRAVLAACRAGLDALDRHLLTLGSTELRAEATRHGRDLGAIALRNTQHARDGWRLLVAAERWRATALSGRPVSRQDPELSHALTSLRALVRQLEENRAADRPTAALEREHRRLERRIRDLSRLAPGESRAITSPPDRERVIEALGEAQLIDLVEIDGRLHVMTVVDGHLRRHVVDATPSQEVEHTRFLLRRTAHGLARWDADQLFAEVGGSLQERLFGGAVEDLEDDRPVVIVPPGSLQAVPWAMLPVLRHRPVWISPSVTTLVDHREVPESQGPTVFVAGPGLTAAASELARISANYPSSIVLTGERATTDAVLAVLDGCSLAHIAAHGTFRLDNPMFSSLGMHDGPVTVHDVERLVRAPQRILLPCCDSAVGAPAGADELLGLVSSLMALGTVGVVGAIVPVNDEATATLMIALHEALRSGMSLAESLLSAREKTSDGPVGVATGLSFLAFGW